MRSGVALCALVALAVAVGAAALDNGLARTPQMGWNSWNKFGCNVSDVLVRATAKALVSTGLRDAGYNYVNMDDCWQISRDAQGRIVPDPQRFPDGIQPLAAFVHSLGLKFGLYSDAGEYTCQHRPGSLNHETIDAQTYAAWGVDYLKYDNCYNDNIPPKTRYPPMRDALNATGHPIFFSMCEWGQDNPAEWAPAVGNSWRTTQDISDSFASMILNLDLNDEWYGYAGPGGWNDPDMLEVGNGGMTDDEYRAHFSLWALVKAPLIIGCDVTDMSNATLETLTNAEVIAVNQDVAGVQGHRVAQYAPPGPPVPVNARLEVWAGLVHDGWVVVLFNRSPSAATITAQWSDIGVPEDVALNVRDLWAHKDLGRVSGSVSAQVASHAVVMYKLTP